MPDRAFHPTPSTAVLPGDDAAARLFALSIGVFFIGGFLSSLVSLFVPRLTLIYGLDYSRALLVQLAFHTSYLVLAVPIGLAIMRLGYMRAAAIGLAVMAGATSMFLWSLGLRSYAMVLLALLALSAGITFLQIAGNTVVAVVGDAHGAAFRLNLLQAFNSVGTVLAPLVGASFVLGRGAGPRGAGEVVAIAPPFVVAIVVLAALALAFAQQRDLLRATPQANTRPSGFAWPALLADRRLMAGTAAIFAYVGAEVTIGAVLTNYLVLPRVLGAAPLDAARLVSLYWAGAMIGRALGAYAMRRIAPATMLATAAIGASGLAMMAAISQGIGGAVALLAVGLCNSIMYPTIYVLALPRTPEQASPAATLLCMAVVGGAVVPMLTGLLADRAGLPPSLLLPASCYLLIAAYGWRCSNADGTER